MKRFLFLVVIILFVLKRCAESRGVSGSAFEGREQEMLRQCDLNFRMDRKEALKESYNEMMECFKKKKMFEVSNDEYVEHIEQCTLYTRANLKFCLTREQRYIPEFTMEVDKELITLRYHFNSVFANLSSQGAINICGELFNSVSPRKIDQCAKLVLPSLSYLKDLKLDKIPNDKETVCRNLATYAKCIREYFEPCEKDVVPMMKRLDDIITYTWKPCKPREIPPLQRS